MIKTMNTNIFAQKTCDFTMERTVPLLQKACTPAMVRQVSLPQKTRNLAMERTVSIIQIQAAGDAGIGKGMAVI